MAERTDPVKRETGKGLPGKKPKARPGKREEALALAREVERARGLVREVGEAVSARLEGRAAALFQALTGEGLPEPPVLPPAERLRRLRRAAAALKVKPSKGRVKDLARLEAFLEALEEVLLP
ncbi:MAG: hypothetical protein ACP5VN_02975 [Acidobacteriota bacterium]